mmetsp:Transcript_58399/g.92739  ORF Transcript_58399/g.92739 Transcript_58399/m.92739 type:complete len:533 (-) Transcript_58399:175-1773(-)
MATNCVTSLTRTVFARTCGNVRFATIAVHRFESHPYHQSKHWRCNLQFRAYAEVALTAERYKVERGAFGIVSDSDVSAFRSIVGSEHVLTDDEADAFNTDWLKTVRGQSKVVVRPANTEEVSKVLKHCHERRLAVCPQGGNTGLCAGSVPVFDEVIVLLGRLNKVESVDPVAGVAVCGAGVVLENLDQAVNAYGLIVPLDLGAKGTCQIGGNISTNAGGLRLLRYGSLHGSVMGVEAVLADGTILDCMSTMRKDNTGYDLKQLFIGSEGTLGIVTRCAILCPPKPKSVKVAFLAVPSWKDVLNVFRTAKAELGEIMSAFEFLDHHSMEVHARNPTMQVGNPISDSPFYVLIETHGSNESHDEQKLENALELLMEKEYVLDGTIGASDTQCKDLWQLRERIAEGLLFDGYCYKYDISLPHDSMYSVVERCRERMGSLATATVGYGHIGDSNLHLNVTTPVYSDEVMRLLEPWLQEETAKVKGSVSAEHGLGFKKKDQIYFSKSTAAVQQMQLMKKVFDPLGIMNPYKTIPDAA